MSCVLVINPQRACVRGIVVILFVFLLVCLFSVSLSVNGRSRRSLHYNGQNRHKCEKDDDLSPFNVPLFELQSCYLEKVKKLPFEHTFGPHPFI